MFDLHKFIIDTIITMVGKEPEHKVRQYALAWFEKDVLTENDLLTVEQALEDYNAELLKEEILNN